MLLEAKFENQDWRLLNWEECTMFQGELYWNLKIYKDKEIYKTLIRNIFKFMKRWKLDSRYNKKLLSKWKSSILNKN